MSRAEGHGEVPAAEELPARCSTRAFIALSAGSAARAACPIDAPRALFPAGKCAYVAAWLSPTDKQPLIGRRQPPRRSLTEQVCTYKACREGRAQQAADAEPGGCLLHNNIDALRRRGTCLQTLRASGGRPACGCSCCQAPGSCLPCAASSILACQALQHLRAHSALTPGRLALQQEVRLCSSKHAAIKHMNVCMLYLYLKAVSALYSGNEELPR